MSNGQGVEGLFFDLASESRLGILHELRKQNLKMNELARKLDMTATETVRQLQRLSDARLVMKQPEGDYALTEYCKLILQLSPAMEFTFKNRDYFSSRDLWRIPYEFLNRIGELTQSELITNVADSLNSAQRIVKEAEHYIWTIGDKSLDSIAPLMLDRYNGGVKQFRFMIAENLLPPNRPSQGRVGIEERTLPQIPAMVICTEKEAAVCFLEADGRADYAGFFGADPMFRKWVNDFFLQFWNVGKRIINQ
jgi:predicted transcriptional regulator